jgi:hypothetical protein
MGKITYPHKSTNSVEWPRMQVNSDNSTPVFQQPTSEQNSTSIVTVPKGPDGEALIQNDVGNAWVPRNKKGEFTAEQINSATKNGTDTENILKNGFNAVLGNSKSSSPFSRTSGGIPSVIDPSSTNQASFGANDQTTKLFAQQLWKYKVVLLNHMQRYELPTRAIKMLTIEDDFLTWPLRGSIVIDNRLEGFEKSTDFDKFYFVRADARDEILIEMEPIVSKGTLPEKIWKIDMIGIVYDVEDLPHKDMTIKAKRFYFWDKRFQNLLEKNIQWSTATGKRFISNACPTPVAHASDDDRAMYTGEAIASILHEVGYADIIDNTKWDWGKGKINFVAKSEWSAWDCINYILQQQISNDEKFDICSLYWNRGDKKLNLTPMWKFFEEAGIDEPKKLQIEHMFFEDPVSDNIKLVTPNKAPLCLTKSYEKDIKADDFNKIKSYRFSQTSGLDNAMAFVSRPVYSHWHKNKQFDVDVKENEIKNVKDTYFKENYVSRVLSVGNFPVMTMNKTKTDQKSIKPQFSNISTINPKTDRYIRSLEGRGKILYAGLFLNQNLVIRMQGSTHRIAGTFIGIDRAKISSDNIYDYQLCGQYFVTNVKHIIQQQKYVNDITMVKVHSYDKLPVNEGVE